MAERLARRVPREAAGPRSKAPKRRQPEAPRAECAAGEAKHAA